jgi:hypothetical protein
LPKMSKYVPPHLRAAAAAGAPAPMPEPAVTQSHTEWLKEQQSRYKVVVKTPEQLRAEYDAMTFEQLKSRAGPPPPITSDDYGGVHEQGGEGEGGRVCIRFDGDIRYFKQTPSRCPPPEPLFFGGRDDGQWAGDGVTAEVYLGLSETQKARSAYARWYSEWGKRLRAKWYEAHPEQIPKSERCAPKPKPKIREAAVEERTEPSRGALAAAAEVAANSGW